MLVLGEHTVVRQRERGEKGLPIVYHIETI